MQYAQAFVGWTDYTEYIQEPVVNLLCPHMPNYYHFIAEGLTRCQVMQIVIKNGMTVLAESSFHTSTWSSTACLHRTASSC